MKAPPPDPHDTGRGWYHRRYLPHYDSSKEIQFLTWRLADSLPRPLLANLEAELAYLLERPDQQELERRRAIETLLDKGYGNCWLRRKAVASIVWECLFLGNGRHYQLHAAVLMPNHVHILVHFLPGNAMGDILEAWKASTGHKANEVLRREGAFWHEDFWDRYIRDQRHYENCVRYIKLNPLKAGLVKCIDKWEWWWTSERLGYSGG